MTNFLASFNDFSDKRLVTLENNIVRSLSSLLIELDKVNGKTSATDVTVEFTSVTSECIEVQAGMMIFVFTYDGEKVTKALKRINSSMAIDLDYLENHPLVPQSSALDIVDLLELLDRQILNFLNFHNSVMLWKLINSNKKY